MAKKKPTKKTKPVKSTKITREEYLKHLILVSENANSGHGTAIDDFFKEQTEKLKKELAGLKTK